MPSMEQNQALQWLGNLQQYPLEVGDTFFWPGWGFLCHQALKGLQKRGQVEGPGTASVTGRWEMHSSAHPGQSQGFAGSERLFQVLSGFRWPLL